MADPYNLGLGTTATNPYIGQQNPQLQGIIDMSSRDMVDNYNRTTQPAFNAAMVRSGSFGNSGIDAANQVAQKNLQTNLGDLSSKLRFNDYSQQQDMYRWQQQQDASNQQFNLGFGRSLNNDAYAQNMGNLQAGIGLLGTLGGYNQQDINNSTTQQNAPLNYWQQFTNVANGVANGFGTTTSNQTAQSNPLVSGLGGAQIASSWWNGRNNGGGSSTPISQPNQQSFEDFGGSNNWWGTGT
jgi:hypothetical protein